VKKHLKKLVKKVVPAPKVLSTLPEMKQEQLKDEVAETIKSVMKKTHVKKAVKHDKITKPWQQMDRNEKKLSAADDQLSPAERNLIEAAQHEDPSKLQRAKLQLGPNVGMEAIEEKLSVHTVPVKQTDAQLQKSVMKKAMEKITKRAAQKAVMTATTTIPELHAPGVDLKKTLKSVPKEEPAAPTFKNDALQNARAIVYGTPVKTTLAKMHSPGPAESPTEDKETPEATLKSVEDMRRAQQLKLKQKFQQLETQSTKASESSWQKQLEAADRKAAQMAQHRALPLSPIEISRAALMRKQLAAQYRADAAVNSPQTETTSLFRPAPWMLTTSSQESCHKATPVDDTQDKTVQGPRVC